MRDIREETVTNGEMCLCVSGGGGGGCDRDGVGWSVILETESLKQERALTLIGQGRQNKNIIRNTYGIESLQARRRKHHLALMYRLSRIDAYIDQDRPEIVLRNRLKIKFITPKTKLTKVMKSPYYRGVTLWDMLPLEIQRATTKVKFKGQVT